MSGIGNTLIPMVEHECTQLTMLLGSGVDVDNARMLAQSGKTLHAVLHLFAAMGGVKESRDFDTACRLLNISSTLEPVKRPTLKAKPTVGTVVQNTTRRPRATNR